LVRLSVEDAPAFLLCLNSPCTAARSIYTCSSLLLSLFCCVRISLCV
jgi:hypothetical protein